MSEPLTARVQQASSAQAQPAAGNTPQTDYIILEESTADRSWKQRVSVTARTPEAAIRAHLGDKPADGGTFIAVPARSWKPVTVKVEQTTRITLT